MSTTSLKLPEEIKALAIAAAKRQGVTPHAFMVEAIRSAANADEKRARFVADAVAARAEMYETGEAYRAEDVHAYLRAKVDGGSPTPPKPTRWRG